MPVHASSPVMISRTLPIALLVALAVASPRPARADDAATASALFDEGKTLFAAGRYAAARDKLQASFELSPLSGTAGLLAACHERTGKLASAWARYRDAAALAERSGNKERAAIASARAADLEARLARLKVDRPARPLEGVVITRDGARVPDAALGTPMPVDAGTYTLVAEAPDHQRWTRTITIRDGERKSVAIPSLEPQQIVVEHRPDPAARRCRSGSAWPSQAWAAPRWRPAAASASRPAAPGTRPRTPAAMATVSVPTKAAASWPGPRAAAPTWPPVS
jgi:hypothetical protein